MIKDILTKEEQESIMEAFFYMVDGEKDHDIASSISDEKLAKKVIEIKTRCEKTFWNQKNAEIESEKRRNNFISEEIANSYELLSNFIREAKVDYYYNFPKTYNYKWFKIDMNKEYGEIYYHWSLERNYDIIGSVGYVYPMKTSNYINTWKTEKGAKQNLIKSLAWIYNK